jgi:hypothetical protein
VKTRIVALVAVAGFAGVASAQSVQSSLSVAGASNVGGNAYEVDISGGDAGSLTITLFSQVINPGNTLGIASVRGDINTANSGVDVAFSNSQHLAPYTLLPTVAPGATTAYQPGLDSSLFPAAGPQPDSSLLGNAGPVAMFSFVIDFSNATDGGTLVLTNVVPPTGAQVVGGWFAFFGVWQPTGNVAVPYTGAEAVTITFVPAPGALALLGLGGLVAGRRRR